MAGRPALGTFPTGASALPAEALGHGGYEFVIVDLQHGENNLWNLQGMLQALSSTPATPLIRVPANMPVHLQRSLDLGAYGVVVPLVNSAEDAVAVLQSVRYVLTMAHSLLTYSGGCPINFSIFVRNFEENDENGSRSGSGAAFQRPPGLTWPTKLPQVVRSVALDQHARF
jgi:hypothetical protein